MPPSNVSRPLAASDAVRQMVDHKKCWLCIQEGKSIPFNLLQSLLPARVVEANLKETIRSEGSVFEFKRLKEFEPRIVRYAINQMLRDIEALDTADEKSGAYYHLRAFMKLFKVQPEDFLRDTHSVIKRDGLSQIFREGAQAFARRSLAMAYDLAPVSEADTAILEDRSGKPIDRLNALLRPLKYEDFNVAMTALEETGHDLDDPDFVDDIIPSKVFNRVAVSDFDLDQQRAREKMWNDVSERLTRVEHAASLSEKSRLYGEVIDALAKYKVTPPKFVEHHPIPEWRDIMLLGFQDGACAFAKYHLQGVLTACPLSSQDKCTLKSQDALATDKLNILFRDSSKVCIRILNALEDAGLDFDDASWVQRIIPEIAFTKPKDPVLPVLVSK